ncbi:hypothetical protein ACOMHN_042389 [Nucella lapillus]
MPCRNLGGKDTSSSLGSNPSGHQVLFSDTHRLSSCGTVHHTPRCQRHSKLHYNTATTRPQRSGSFTRSSLALDLPALHMNQDSRIFFRSYMPSATE